MAWWNDIGRRETPVTTTQTTRGERRGRVEGGKAGFGVSRGRRERRERRAPDRDDVDAASPSAHDSIECHRRDGKIIDMDTYS